MIVDHCTHDALNSRGFLRYSHELIDCGAAPRVFGTPRETERAVQASPDRIEPALGDILGGSIKASRDKLENGFDLRAVKSLEPL